MRIAINTRFLLSKKMEGFGWFTYEIVKRIVLNHPEHEFIFFFDRKYDPKFVFADNVKAVVLSPPARHPILFKIWFNRSITRALKKYKADLFFSPDGYLSLKTETPQIGVIHDLNFEHYPQDLPKSALKYLRTFFPLFAKKAHHIITVSNYSKKDICNTYQIKPEKVTVAHNAANEIFKPVTESEREEVKRDFSANQDFFVFVGALHARKNVARLFSAFEAFKNQTTSKTQLLIVGEAMWGDQRIEKAYQTNAFKNHIHFTGHLPLEQLARVVASARALLFPSYFEGFGIPLVEAMQSGTAVCCANKTSLPEVVDGAALMFDPFDTSDMASQLVKIDENEALRNELVQKGLERAKAFSWDQSAQIIWNTLEKTMADL